MPEQAGDKSQEATPHRREELRQQGQVARSQDFASALLLLLGLIALGLTAGKLIDFLGSLTQRQLGGQQWGVPGQQWLATDADSVVAQYNRLLAELAEAVLPLLAMVFVAGVVVNLMQVGFMFLPEKAAPDLSRIDPLQGLRRIFSLSNVMRLVFGILKIAVLAAVAGVCLYGQRHNILGMTGMSVPQIAASLCGLLFWTAVKMAIALVLLALLDWGFQLWKYERDIRTIRAEAPHIGLLNCQDEYLFPTLVHGVDGALVGCASLIPELIVELHEAVQADDLKRARQLNDRIWPVKEAVYGSGEPSGDAHARLKEGMAIRGLLPSPLVRPPVLKPSPEEIARVRAALAASGVSPVQLA